MSYWQNSCNKQHQRTSIIAIAHNGEGQLLTHVGASRFFFFFFTMESDKTTDMQTLGIAVVYIQGEVLHNVFAFLTLKSHAIRVKEFLKLSL